MDRGTKFAWVVTFAAIGALIFVWTQEEVSFSAPEVLFWIGLLMAASILPVSLGFGAELTMSFPIHLAVEIIFQPPLAMLIAGIGSVDLREIRREIPLHRALFNRAQLMLTAGVASTIIHLGQGQPFTFPEDFILITLGVLAHFLVNHGLVVSAISWSTGSGFRETWRAFLPKPVTGYWGSQVLLAGLGAATAAAYRVLDYFVAALLIPLLFARLSILGAKASQELSERLRRQQEALLAATEQVFQERENERKRIAADIHDSSLQLMAAAAYGVGNATDLLQAGRSDDACRLLASSKEAIEQAMQELREALVDLRRSSIEAGGLVETINAYIDQVSTLWGTQVQIEGSIDNEPPIPVALAAFQILQEGLVNALKHAGSHVITVRLREEDNMVHIIVEDDGDGFDPEAEIGTDHVGMRLMKERAARVGGYIELDSVLGQGTRLRAVLPAGVTS